MAPLQSSIMVDSMEEVLPLTVSPSGGGHDPSSPTSSSSGAASPKSSFTGPGVCTTRYLILVFLNVLLAVFVLYMNLASTSPCGDLEEIKKNIAAISHQMDGNGSTTEDSHTASALPALPAAASSSSSAASAAVAPPVTISTTSMTPKQDLVNPRAIPVKQVDIDVVSYILQKKMTNICLVQGSGLCSNIMNIMGQKILFGDKGRGFVVDDSYYNYKWKDEQTGVLLGFFTPQFPVLGPKEWDRLIKPRFQTSNLDNVVGVGMSGIYRSHDQRLEVQWCPGERYRGFFPPVYGTSGEALYDRFVQETCDSFQFNDLAKLEIEAIMEHHHIPDLRDQEKTGTSVAFHARRGDKLIGESRSYAGSEYVDKLLEVTGTTKPKIDHCFITSDDYAAVEEIQLALKQRKIKCKMHTLTKSDESGSDFRVKRNGPTDFESTIEFMSQLSLMVDATYFIGTFNSNVGSVVSLMRKCVHEDAPHYAHSYGVDQEDWFYRLH